VSHLGVRVGGGQRRSHGAKRGQSVADQRRGWRRGRGRRSLFGDSGLAHGFENGFDRGQIRRIVAHRRPKGVGAGNGEGRVERETGPDRGIRLVQSTNQCEGGGQLKVCRWKISVDLDRPSKPRDGLLVTADVELRRARRIHPDISHRIARTEAQGLIDVSLSFFCAPDVNLAISDKGMSAGEISIQLQRMCGLGYALRSTFGLYLNASQVHVCASVVWDRRQGLGQLRFGRGEGRGGVGHKGIYALAHVRDRRSNERVDILGVGRKRALEKAARLRDIVRGHTLIEPSLTLKIEVHRVGGRGLFGATRLGGGELGVERACQPRDDFVLHIEEIGERLVEPLGQR
jgi:hypothetical protein